MFGALKDGVSGTFKDGSPSSNYVQEEAAGASFFVMFEVSYVN